ncbi:MAG: NADH-quinone oxidoreductase subunit M [Acidimicrobiia bacterium]
MSFPLLTSIILIPVIGAGVVALLPRRRRELVLPIALGVSLLTFGASLYLLWEFQAGEAGFQFTERVTWYEPWGVSYHLGVDGISLLLVLLTTFLMPVSLLASTSITHRLKEYAASMLFLEAGILGVFLSLDLLVFFVFWEVMLVPMYFIIGVWGGERRIYAAVKFFLYTALGSALMLAGILALAFIGGDQLGSPTFDFTELLGVDITRGAQFWLFAAFGLSFAIKVPIFPFHTWLPDAHVEAPTAGSVILAGVLLKLGAYGFIRFNLNLFPEASVDLVPVLAVLGVIGILYGAVVAIVQPDVKRLVAFSSVSHLGFVVLGIFALTSQGLQGGVIQMVNHGLTTGALFLLVGMIYDRRHTREIAAFGGIAKVMPVFAGAFLFIALASIGLPGLNGFVGEFLVLLGSYLTLPVYAILAGFGVVLAAVYLLWAYQRVFTGPITKPENEALRDVGAREVAILAPIVALVLFLGIYPKPALERIEPSVDQILARIERETDYEVPEFGRDIRLTSGAEALPIVVAPSPPAPASPNLVK